ncbi:MAG: thiamine pyrophosphate-dependent enzyme, partial [Candidatus Thorarchaeota archaeon]
MTTIEQLEGVQKITWCTGCGNFGILAALKKALVDLDIPEHEMLLVSGIGCSSKIPHYINVNSIHTLHGRPIPFATGAHMANQDLKVFVHTGDGDCLAEGLGHFLHAARRNVNLAVFIHNNGVNGLTKGQFSPAAPRGYVSKTSPPPPGAPMDPVNPLALAIVSGATFVARGFSGKQKELMDLMSQAIEHKGFAVVDILQPCQTWNRQLTWKYYNDRVYSLEEAGHDPTNKPLALERSMEFDDKVPIGVLYRAESPDLATGLSLPEDGRLRDHKTN